MKFDIVIPYKYVPGLREENFQFVKEWYKTNFPEANIILGLDDSGNQKFYRSYAINNGVAAAENEVILVSDGDLFLDKKTLTEAFKLLDESPFVIPFGRCIDIKPAKSRAIIKKGIRGNLEKLIKHKMMIRDIRVGKGIYGFDKCAGGLQLFRKEFFESIGGMDERFITWGYEDTFLCKKIMKILGDYPIVEDGYCYHLFHERNEDWTANKNLFYKLIQEELNES